MRRREVQGGVAIQILGRLISNFFVWFAVCGRGRVGQAVRAVGLTAP